MLDLLLRSVFEVFWQELKILNKAHDHKREFMIYTDKKFMDPRDDYFKSPMPRNLECNVYTI